MKISTRLDTAYQTPSPEQQLPHALPAQVMFIPSAKPQVPSLETIWTLSADPPDSPEDGASEESDELYADDAAVDHAVLYEEAVLYAHDVAHEEAVLNSVCETATLAQPNRQVTNNKCRMLANKWMVSSECEDDFPSLMYFWRQRLTGTRNFEAQNER